MSPGSSDTRQGQKSFWLVRENWSLRFGATYLAVAVLASFVLASCTPKPEGAVVQSGSVQAKERSDRDLVREWLDANNEAVRAQDKPAFARLYDESCEVRAFRGAPGTKVALSPLPEGYEGDQWIIDVVPNKDGSLEALCLVEYVSRGTPQGKPGFTVGKGYTIYKFKRTQTGLLAVSLTSLNGIKGVDPAMQPGE